MFISVILSFLETVKCQPSLLNKSPSAGVDMESESSVLVFQILASRYWLHNYCVSLSRFREARSIKLASLCEGTEHQSKGITLEQYKNLPLLHLPSNDRFLKLIKPLLNTVY